MQEEMVNTSVFDPNDWITERSSGFLGYRNTKTGKWIYNIDYIRMMNSRNDNINMNVHNYRELEIENRELKRRIKLLEKELENKHFLKCKLLDSYMIEVSKSIEELKKVCKGEMKRL